MSNTLKSSLSWLTTLGESEQDWEDVPLRHSNIQAMDMKQIADLPISAGRHCIGAVSHHQNELGNNRPSEATTIIRHSFGRLSVAVPLAGMLLAALIVVGSDALARSPGNTAAFRMPADFDHWQPDILGHNGAYRFRQVNGNCQITFVQNRGADAAHAVGQKSQHSIDAYINRVAAKVGRVERVEVDTFELKSKEGNLVPFISTEFAYMGNDDVEYHNRISAAWIGDVELLIISACPASDWIMGRSLINAFVSKATVSEFSTP